VLQLLVRFPVHWRARVDGTARHRLTIRSLIAPSIRSSATRFLADGATFDSARVNLDVAHFATRLTCKTTSCPAYVRAPSRCWLSHPCSDSTAEPTVCPFLPHPSFSHSLLAGSDIRPSLARRSSLLRESTRPHVGYDPRARSGLRNDPDAARLVSSSRRRQRPCLFSCDSTASCEPAFHLVASLSINRYSTLSLPGSFPSPTDIPFTTSNSSPATEPASSHVPWRPVFLQLPVSSSRSPI
jgi:hypothetical protein